jgi:CRP-like cAMP-binding protein
VEGDKATSLRVVDFAAGESVQTPNRRFEGFALIIQGKATLQTTDGSGRMVEVGEMVPGECFGDQVAVGGASDGLAIIAREDLKILVFDNEAIAELLKRSPGLAAEMGDAIESRRQAVQAARYRR